MRRWYSQPKQKQRLYRRRSALLSGLIATRSTPECLARIGRDHRPSGAPTSQADARDRHPVQPERSPRTGAASQSATDREPIQHPAASRTTVQAPRPAPDIPRRHSQPSPPSAESAHPSRWRQIAARLRPRRVPVLVQMSAVECGAACLAMILSYYGRKTQRLRGAQALPGWARWPLGAGYCQSRAQLWPAGAGHLAARRRPQPDSPCPAIVHWEFNHFLVVERTSSRWVEVVDPAVGRRRLTYEEFFNGFTGIVLMLEPGVQFERTDHAPAASPCAAMRAPT